MNLNKAYKKINHDVTKAELMKEIEQKLTPRITTAMSAAFILSLHDGFDWGPVRLNRLLERVDKQFDAIMEDYCTVEDIKQAVFDETKIDLR